MTDHDLELRLRAWYRAEISDNERAPLQLRTDLSILQQTAAKSRRWTTIGWKFPPMTLVVSFSLTATAVVLALLIGVGVILRTPDVGPSPVPSPTPDTTPAATVATVAPAWRATGSMIEARSGYTATLLANGKVLVAGGSSSALTSAELYDPATGSWTSTGPMLQARPEGYTTTLLPNGTVLMAGGYDRGALASAEVYDPSSGTWAATGTMQRGVRFYHTATLLLDGTVLVAGGIGHGEYLSSAELYDPRTGTWTVTGSMGEARENHTATLLPDGRVLVVGGSGMPSGRSDGSLASAELYDPRTGTWTVTGSLTEARLGYTPATLLPDGKVLVAGGDSATLVVQPDVAGPRSDALTLASVELYDPGSGSWTVIGSMTEARRGHTVTLLPDGTVLVAGGSRNDSNGSGVLATAELYDPSSGSWTITTGMIEPRAGHTATPLPNGTVLVAGGTDRSALVELYDPGGGS